MKKKTKAAACSVVVKAIFLVIGAILYSIGLEIFLIPNNVIDGGVVGISIMANHFINIPLGILTMILNIPFFIIGYKNIGKAFTVSTLFTVIIYSLEISILKPIPEITDDIFLASVFGGVIEGFGVGLIIRSGGSTDGAEIVAIILDKKMTFSVGEIVMFFNFFILSAAGFIFGWDRAMYSLVAYFISGKVIDAVVEGLDESKSVMIITDKYDEISSAIINKMGKEVTLLEGKGGYTSRHIDVLYVVVSRLEISKMKSLVQEFDDDALITIGSVESYGKKRNRNFTKQINA